MKQEKAFGYLRVSGLGQVNGGGFDRQMDTIRRYARTNAVELVETYRDEGVSGKKELAERTGLAALLDRLESNGIRLVLVERADRLARDLMVSEVILGQFRDLGARLITISSVDTRPGIELLYHLAFDRAGLVCTVRTIVPKPSPEIESITPAIPGAEWVEREIHELMGVDFLNHPNLAPLILADDWPEGSYPLRRSDG